jgi:hypothetical protein
MKINEFLVDFSAAAEAVGMPIASNELMSELFSLNKRYPVLETNIKNGVGTIGLSFAQDVGIGKVTEHTFTFTFSPELTALNTKLLSQSNAGKSLQVNLRKKWKKKDGEVAKFYKNCDLGGKYAVKVGDQSLFFA